MIFLVYLAYPLSFFYFKAQWSTRDYYYNSLFKTLYCSMMILELSAAFPHRAQWVRLAKSKCVIVNTLLLFQERESSNSLLWNPHASFRHIQSPAYKKKTSVLYNNKPIINPLTFDIGTSCTWSCRCWWAMGSWCTTIKAHESGCKIMCAAWWATNASLLIRHNQTHRQWVFTYHIQSPTLNCVSV